MNRLLSFIASFSIFLALSGCKDASVFDSTFDFEDIPTFSITYDKNGATSGDISVDSQSPYQNGSNVTVLGNTGLLVRAGHDFLGWNTVANGSGVSYNANDTFVIKQDTVLYAQWAQQEVSITYNGNGNTGGAVPVDANSPYTHSSNVTVMNEGTLVRSSHVFSGWNTAADGSGDSYSVGASFNITADTILYAQWSELLEVVYNGNGNTAGTVPSDNNSPYVSGSTVTVLGNTGTLTRTGHNFLGWNTAANGSGTSYSAGATFSITQNTTLYAQWEVQTFTASYDGNGNTGGAVPTDASSPYNYNSTVTVLANTFTRTNYTFMGWNTAANGSGTNYSLGDTFTITADTTLYARWASSVSTLSSATLNIGAYAPAFSASTLSYTKSVSCEVGATNIRPTATNNNATIKVSINGGSSEDVDSGSASDALSLTGGQANVIRVVVTAEDQTTTTTYNFTVTRAPTDMTCGLEAFWRLDEAPNATFAGDISSNGRNLNATNVTFGASGQTNSGVNFGGGTSYLYSSALAPLNITHVTVSAWIYPTAYPAVMNPIPNPIDLRKDRTSIAGFAQGSPAVTYDKMIMMTPDGYPQFYVYCDSSLAKFTSVPTPVVPLNTWTHLVGVVDGINVYMYINGVKVASTTCGSTYTEYDEANLIIGGTTARSERYFNGRIDEVGIWRRGFNDAEVLELYNSGY